MIKVTPTFTGNMKDVRNLINAGANVNVPNGNNSPLHLASGIGNFD